MHTPRSRDSPAAALVLLLRTLVPHVDMCTTAIVTRLLCALLLVGAAVGFQTPADGAWALTIDRPLRFSRAGPLAPQAAALPAWASTPLVPLEKDIATVAADAIARLFAYRNADLDFNSLSWWQAANAYAAVASLDLFTGPAHRAQVGAGLRRLIARGDERGADPVGLENAFNDDSLWWALACVDAHQAYGDAAFAAEAQRLWQHVKNTSLVLETGVAPNMGGIQRTVVVSDQCALEYGTYWTTKPDEIYLNSVTTGLMAQASARINEAVVPADELIAVVHGAIGFLRRHTVDAGQLLVNQDGVEGDDCSVSPNAYTYNTGMSLHPPPSLPPY